MKDANRDPEGSCLYARLLRFSPSDQGILLDALRSIDPSFSIDRTHAPGTKEARAEELRLLLRHLLKVPDDGDLPEYMRRRFVEAARDFGLGPDLDMYSDEDLAEALMSVVLELTAGLEPGSEDWGEFARYFRTLRGRDKRAKAVDELNQALSDPWTTAQLAEGSVSAHELDASTLTQGLMGLSTTQVLMTAGALGATGAFPVVGIPLAVALASSGAGAYLAGLRRGAPRAALRAKRARLSTRIQAVMVLATCMTIEQDA